MFKFVRPLLLAALMLVAGNGAALASMERYDGRLWLVVASRSSPQAAVQFARTFRERVSPAFVVYTRNGTYAIVAGHLDAERAEANRDMLATLRLVPPDAFLSLGKHFDALVWPDTNSVPTADVVTSNALLRSVASMQSALARLGYYRSTIDGLIGTGTKRAYRAFERKHGRVGHQVRGWTADQVLAALERRANPQVLQAQADRRRADQDRRAERDRRKRLAKAEAQARSNGFADVEEQARAKEAGFRVAQAYRDARSNGFERASEYEAARKAGFETRNEVRHARAAGYANAADYAAFTASGFDRPTDWEAAKRRGYANRTAALDGERAAWTRLHEETNTLMEDAAVFVQLRRDPAVAVAVASSIAAVRAALDAEPSRSVDAFSDAGQRLRGAANALASLLGRTPAFANFRQEREVARNAKLASALNAEREGVADLQRGLRSWMVENLLDERIVSINGLLAEIDNERPGDDVAAWRGLAERTRKALDDAGLLSTIEAFGRRASSKDNAPGETRTIAGGSGGEAVDGAFTPTDRTRFLVKGALDEVLVLYTTRDAPHIARNLRGDFVFSGGQVRICLTHGLPDGLTGQVLTKAVVALPGGPSPTIERMCAADALHHSDIVLMQRGAFLKGDKALAAELVSDVEDGRLRAFALLDDATLKAQAKAETDLVASLTRDLETGTRSGFAAIALGRSGEACLAGDSAAAALALHAARLADGRRSRDLPDHDAVVSMSVDEAFIAVQRGRCALVYGATDEIGPLALALKRDGFAFEVPPFHYAMSDHETALAALDGRRSALADEREDVAAQAALARSQARARDRLEQVRANTDASTRERRTAALRAANLAPATARLNAVERLAKVAFGQANDAGAGALADAHAPGLVRFQRQLTRERWEHRSLDTSIEDFADARWDGRSVEAVVVRLRPRISNADLGQYRTPCFRIAALFDDEFGKWRGVRELGCQEDDELAAWSDAHELKSRWTATPADTASAD